MARFGFINVAGKLTHERLYASRRGAFQTALFSTVPRSRDKPPLLEVERPSAGDMKRIFLTGASAGIGLATAKLLAERGDEVWGTSRDPARLPQLSRLHPVRLDLSDNVSLGKSFRIALREAGHFDGLINKSGSQHFG